jgi:hypothetical protein
MWRRRGRERYSERVRAMIKMPLESSPWIYNKMMLLFQLDYVHILEGDRVKESEHAIKKCSRSAYVIFFCVIGSLNQ